MHRLRVILIPLIMLLAFVGGCERDGITSAAIPEGSTSVAKEIPEFEAAIVAAARDVGSFCAGCEFEGFSALAEIPLNRLPVNWKAKPYAEFLERRDPQDPRVWIAFKSSADDQFRVLYYWTRSAANRLEVTSWLEIQKWEL